MATIIKREVNKKKYFYISHSYREGGEVHKFDKYLGKKIPEFEDLVKIWEEFSHEFVEKRWLPTIKKIYDKYQKIIEKTPLSILSKNLRNFGIRFTHHSNKIEGSTLSLRDVQAVIDNKTLPHDKSVDDAIETKAHMMIYQKMINTTEDLSMDLIIEWHEELFHITKPTVAGYIRDYPVEIKGSNYEPPMYKIEINELLNKVFDWYNEYKEKYNPVFLAAVIHYRFIAIHPFGDGNGRLTRLITNYILHKNTYPMFDIDAKDRLQYYKALENTDKREDNEFPFISWFFKNYVKSNKKYF